MKLFKVHANSSITVYPTISAHWHGDKVEPIVTTRDIIFEREDILYEGPNTTGFIYRSNKQTYSIVVGNSDVRMIG